MKNHLKRVLTLVQKTGDTMIVVDKEGNDAFVVMDLDRYEAILDVEIQENDLFEDQNNESLEEIKDSGMNPRSPDIWNLMQGAEEEGETWDIDQLSEGELTELEKQYQAFANRNVEEAIEENQLIPSTKQKELKNENAIPDDVYGEEQFYLEPIE